MSYAVPQSGRFCSGFTLIEVLFAVILVGLAIAGLTAANYAFTQANGAGADLSTAEYLAEQIHELTATMTVDQIYAFNGTGTSWRAAINPPVDARNVSLGTTFSAWSQQIKVEKLQKDLSTPDTTSASPSFYRITVQVLRGGKVITSASWIRARY
jgi:prepilin-type N-terminal cleavage/methylation domain-containing protein